MFGHFSLLLLSSLSPLVVGQLFLNQKEIGLQLVPLEDHVTHLLLGETGPIRVPQVNDHLICGVNGWTVL